MSRYYCPHCGGKVGMMGHDCDESKANRNRPEDEKIYVDTPVAKWCPKCTCKNCQQYQRGRS